MRIVQTAVLLFLFASALTAAKTLDIYVVDVEGGKALLLVSPSGESMLIDAGNPGSNDRDAIRIVEACKAAGVTKIDYMVVSHYDGDHVANVPTLMQRISAVTFVDHGENVQQNAIKTYAAYMALVAKAKHLIVKPGDKIPIKGFDAFVATSAGQAIAKPLKGAGQPNAACDTTPRKTWGPNARGVVDNHDTNENGMSIGLLVTYGKFRMFDPADLTWNKERRPDVPRESHRHSGLVHGQQSRQRQRQFPGHGPRTPPSGGHRGQFREEVLLSQRVPDRHVIAWV